MSAQTNFADRLIEAIRRVGTPLCVGLDPVVERIPAAILRASTKRSRGGRTGAASLLATFSRRVLDALVDVVLVVKIQVACFELYGAPGMAAFESVARHARRLGYVVVGDLKRGDIGASSTHYARAYLGAVPFADGTSHRGLGLDALTVNPYLGSDSVDPFLEECANHGCGLFVVAASSNPGAAQFQGRPEDRSPLYRRIAVEASRWGEGLIGSRGYSSVGLVVGATRPEVAVDLRSRLPRTFFLVPGIGVQGAKIDQIAPFFDQEGLGALVAISRSLIFAYESHPRVQWERAVRQAALDYRGLIEGGLTRRRSR